MENRPTSAYPTNDIADKIIRGENVDIAEALKEEQKQRQRREADAVRLQLLCARIAKAIGRNVEQRTLLGAMAVMTAQTICYVHPTRHGKLYVDFLLALKAAIEGTYPKGQLLTPPDMSALDAHIEVRVWPKEAQVEAGAPAAPAAPPIEPIAPLTPLEDVVVDPPVPTPIPMPPPMVPPVPDEGPGPIPAFLARV